MNDYPLKFDITHVSGKARVGKLKLLHSTIDTPVFMPVGTQGTIKGLLSSQIESLGCEIILGNTYHLSQRPGCSVLNKAGGLHRFMNWKKSLLTDSGGFQMVSLLDLCDINEEGVKFQSPHDGNIMMLTPEESIRIQNIIGADIIMQLDDVVSSLTTGERVNDAMKRSIRWLDRCINAHKRKNEQNLFGIVQGGLDIKLRGICCEEMKKRNLPGYAIGGLSGGEDKNQFWRIIDFCTDELPSNKPKYSMGVGYQVDIVVCVALGVDMFDCVYPCRTARFGTALSENGVLKLKNREYKFDFTPITNLDNLVNKFYTRSYFQGRKMNGPSLSSLLTIHNISYMMNLMKVMREQIKKGTFKEWVRMFMKKQFSDGIYPIWCVDALKKAGIDIQ